MLAVPTRRCLSTPALALSAFALACLTAPAAASAEASRACSPDDGLKTSDVARGVRSDGSSEVTEFSPGGGYRVTRCAKDGSVQISQTVSPIVAPGGATVLVPTETETPTATVAMLYGDPTDDKWAASFRGDRAAVAGAVIPPTVAPASPPVAMDPAPAASGPGDRGATSKPDGGRAPNTAGTSGRPQAGGQIAAAAVAGDACTNGQYSFFTSAWGARAYGYYVNRSRFSYNDTSVGSIVTGHVNWDTTHNSCGLNDITNLTSVHFGSTALTIHTYPDGASVTDKGSVSSMCPGSLACTWNFTNASGVTTETDQRYNQDATFTNVGAAGAYDYQSVSAHETGHSIGLDHANSSNALTMYYQVAAGSTYARSLGKGDVMGLRARYP